MLPWLGWPVLLGIGVAATLLRDGDAAVRGVIWAEDGRIFLTDAYRHGLGALLAPYNGYGHVLDRCLAAVIVAVVPLSAQGIAINVTAALGQVLLAVLARAVVASHTRSRWPGWVAFAYIVLVPVGPETPASIANLQWVLLCVAPLAACWLPRGRGGQIGSAVAVAAFVGSSPFGAIAVVVAGLGWLVTRSRFHVALVVIAAVGALTQAVVILGAPAREVSHRIDLTALLSGYARRVVGDGFLGLPSPADASTADQLWRVVLPVLLILALLIVVVRSDRRGLWLPLGLIVLSVGIYAVPTTLGGTLVDNPYADARYFVAPAVLLVCAVLILADMALGNARGWLRQVGRGATVVVVAALVWALAVSYDAPRNWRRDGWTWAEQLGPARAQCAKQAEAEVQVPIWPPPWVAFVPCDRLVE
ncbi:hypothetical protein [Nocardioides sp.]|uniref:hypothetical protein n=1 Tax=Nocardioides sp. TaxID=35761 RepID=UPI0039E589BE